MVNRESLRKKLYLRNEYNYEYQNANAVLTQEEIDFAEKEWGINTTLHRSCINCQVRQLLKYENQEDVVEGGKANKFLVPCKGISRLLPPGSGEVIKKLELQGVPKERAQLLVQSTSDPVAWAELMFGFSDKTPAWCLRPYQKEQLRCTSQRTVIREGRRSGKTFAIALKLLYFIFNKTVDKGNDSEGRKIDGAPLILIVTPFQSQLLNVFDELEKLLKRNKDLSDAVVTSSAESLYVKTPFFRMEFANKGEIKGFVSGIGTKKDGSGGGTMRGQSAHIIYLDEMDMIPEDTLDKAIMPILLSDTTGDTCFIATSTPIGKRGRFYQMCLNDPRFKEDYLPSTVLPQWEKIKQLLLSQGTTKESIQTEYMAAFVDGEYGVFKPTYTNRSRKDYTYEDTANISWWKKNFNNVDTKEFIRCLGIDWNKNAGSEFVITTYMPSQHKYVLTECINIPHGEFSGQRWIEEIVRLNYKWAPDYIYADEGYGETITEYLKLLSHQIAAKPQKTAQDMQTVLIKDRLRVINFSSNLTMRDPIEGKEFHKQAKHFIVEAAKSILEDNGSKGEGIFWMPVSEKQLFDEMSHYVILRRSASSNKPVYGSDSPTIADHRLDAWMLSVGGIQLEAGLFSTNNIDLSLPASFKREELESKEKKTTIDNLRNASTLDMLKLIKSQNDNKPGQGQSRDLRGIVVPRKKSEGKNLNEVERFFANAPVYAGYETDQESRYQKKEEPYRIKRRR